MDAKIFDIEDINVAKYLDIKLKTLRQRLNNEKSTYKIYIEGVDFCKIKNKQSNAGVTYLINYPCFEMLAMNGDSEQSDVIISYFIKLREFLVENQHIIYQSMTNFEELTRRVASQATQSPTGIITHKMGCQKLQQ